MPDRPSDWKVVTKRQPTDEEMRAMIFGWKVVKHVKSNAIVYADCERTLGVGAGQMSRVDSSKIAVWKAGEAGLSLDGSVVCSTRSSRFLMALLLLLRPAPLLQFSPVVQCETRKSLPLPTSAIWPWSSLESGTSNTTRALAGGHLSREHE